MSHTLDRAETNRHQLEAELVQKRLSIIFRYQFSETPRIAFLCHDPAGELFGLIDEMAVPLNLVASVEFHNHFVSNDAVAVSGVLLGQIAWFSAIAQALREKG